MNYLKIYNQIIDRSNQRILEKNIYAESHHIIPKCMGGTNDPGNIAELTGREHFICHWLLARIHPDNKGLIHAFWMMSNCKGKNRYSPSSRAYNEAKILHSLAVSESSFGKKLSEFTKAKISKSNLGKRRTDVQKKNISESLKDKDNGWNDRKHSDDSKIKMANAKIGKKASDETKLKMSISRIGKKHTEEAKKNMSNNMKGISKKKYECDICGILIGGVFNFKRHKDSH
jgi:rubrerythrin